MLVRVCNFNNLNMRCSHVIHCFHCLFSWQPWTSSFSYHSPSMEEIGITSSFFFFGKFTGGLEFCLQEDKAPCYFVHSFQNLSFCLIAYSFSSLNPQISIRFTGVCLEYPQILSVVWEGLYFRNDQIWSTVVTHFL